MFVTECVCVTCQLLLHLLGAEIPLTSLDRILLTSHLAYLSEGGSAPAQVCLKAIKNITTFQFD